MNITLLYNLIIFNFSPSSPLPLLPSYDSGWMFYCVCRDYYKLDFFFTWIVDSGRKKRPCVARETWCGSFRDNVRCCCTAKAVRISLEKGSLLMRRMSFRMLVIDSTAILLKEVMWTRPFSKEELWYNNKESL